MTRQEIIKKLEEDFGMEVLIHTAEEYGYKILYKAVHDYMDSLMEEGNEHVYMFASCIVLDDKSIWGEPMDLWVRFYD